MLLPLVGCRLNVLNVVLHYGLTSELTVAQDILCCMTTHYTLCKTMAVVVMCMRVTLLMQLSVTMIRSCTSAEHEHATRSFGYSATILSRVTTTKIGHFHLQKYSNLPLEMCIHV